MMQSMQDQSHESVNDDQMIDKNDKTEQIKKSTELDQSLVNPNSLSHPIDALNYDRNFLNPEGFENINRQNRSNLDDLLAIPDPYQNPLEAPKNEIQMQHEAMESQNIEPQFSPIQTIQQIVVQPVIQPPTANIEKVD